MRHGCRSRRSPEYMRQICGQQMKEDRQMELSGRLQAVASLVTAGHRIADIGTDHAYIPIFLVQEGRSDSAIAMDVNEGPLKKAEEHVKESGMEGRIELRLSDGLEKLGPGEADTAVIAGMGGPLMLRILKAYPKTVGSLRELVLQPQSETAKVRAFLLEEGFLFLREELVKEDGKYYPMMKVVPPHDGSFGSPGKDGENRKEPVRQGIQPEKKDAEDNREPGCGKPETPDVWDETEVRYGKLLLEMRHPVLRDYLLREEAIRLQILDGLLGQSGERITGRKRELEEELEYIRKGLKHYAV